MRNETQGTSFRRLLPSPVPPHPADVLLTSSRAEKYRQVLARRTNRLAVIVEDCYDPHNATAIIRTCDAFGLNRIFLVTARNAFKVNRRVSQGSHHYVELHLHADIGECYAAARDLGYRILATDLAQDAAIGPGSLAAQLAVQPLALVFGSEGAGLSAQASALADGHALIPMSGFPQSLNLSVSVAVSVYALRQAALEGDAAGDLEPAEQCQLYDRWVRDHKGAAVDKVIEQQGRDGEPLDSFRA